MKNIYKSIRALLLGIVLSAGVYLIVFSIEHGKEVKLSSELSPLYQLLFIVFIIITAIFLFNDGEDKS